MVYHYRETDAVSGRWTGNTSGVKLSSAQADENTYTSAKGIADLNAALMAARGISSITISGNDLIFHMSDSTLEDVTIPISVFLDRGTWAALTAYSINDTFAINGTLYRVLFPHTSAATFAAGANDGMGHDYYSAMLSLPGNALPTGGGIGAELVKTGTADFAVGWRLQTLTTLHPDTAGIADLDPTLGELFSLTPSGDDTIDAISAPVDAKAFVIITTSGVTSRTITFATKFKAQGPLATGTVSGVSFVVSFIADGANFIEVARSKPTDLTGYLPLTGGTLTGALTLAADPASALQPATKQYVDGIAANLGKRARVRLLDSTDSDPATSGYTNGATIDSVTLVTGDQVLRNASGHQARNGVWVVAASGGAARADQFDTYDEHPGTLIAVEEGTSNADSIWLCTSNVGGTLNTTAIVFSQSTASGALLAANNLSDLANASTARGNLGVAIGSNVQAWDADLDALAANSTNGLWAHTGAGTGAARTMTAGNGIGVTNGDGVSGNPTIALSANAQIDVVEFVIDGGGSTLTTGMKGYIEMPFACTITQATLLADQSGSIVVDVFKCSYAQFDAGSTHPVSGDKITASAPPTISSATKAQDATLTGWTTAISAGDILAFNINSVTTCQRVTISLKVSHV